MRQTHTILGKNFMEPHHKISHGGGVLYEQRSFFLLKIKTAYARRYRAGREYCAKNYHRDVHVTTNQYYVLQIFTY